MKKKQCVQRKTIKVSPQKTPQARDNNANLDNWFCQFKVTSSDSSCPAGGGLDPVRLEPLFAIDTKSAIENYKNKATHLSDALPLNEMYNKILTNPNSSHQLTACLS